MGHAVLTDEAFVEALRSQGLRVTPQRTVIHRVMRDREGHATADDVLRLVEPVLPGVSLPTVYATLGLLERLGLVRRVSAPGDRAVYDTRTDAHHHVYCRVCGAVSDLDAPVELQPVLTAAGAAGFTPDWVEVTLTGVCGRCAVRDGGQGSTVPR